MHILGVFLVHLLSVPVSLIILPIFSTIFAELRQHRRNETCIFLLDEDLSPHS